MSTHNEVKKKNTNTHTQRVRERGGGFLVPKLISRVN